MRTCDLVRGVEVVFQELGQADVADFGGAAHGQQDVLSLQVRVQHLRSTENGSNVYSSPEMILSMRNGLLRASRVRGVVSHLQSASAMNFLVIAQLDKREASKASLIRQGKELPAAGSLNVQGMLT